MKKIAYFEFIGSNRFFKKSWEGQQKAGKVSGGVFRTKDQQRVTNLQKNASISEHKMVKTLNISSFTVHNIKKTFWESGENSVHKE